MQNLKSLSHFSFSMVAAVILTACGGGGGGGGSTTNQTPPPSNEPPEAAITGDALVAASSEVTLSGDESSDADGTINTYSWSQTAGESVEISDPSAASIQFTSPATAGASLSFELTVTDDEGESDTISFDTTINTPPSQTTLFPLPEGRFNGEKLLVRGTVQDENGIETTDVIVEAGNVEYSADIADDGTWLVEVPVDLSTSQLQVNVTAYDNFNASSTAYNADLEISPTPTHGLMALNTNDPNFAYLVSQESGLVQIIEWDRTTDSLTKLSMPVGINRGVTDLAYNPQSHQLLLLTEGYERTLWSYDIATGAVEDVVPALEQPVNIDTFAFDHVTGNIYFAESNSNSILAGNIADGELTTLSSEEIGEGDKLLLDYYYDIHNLVYSQTYGLILQQKNYILRIDTETGDRHPLSTISSSPTADEDPTGDPEWITLSPSGDEIVGIDENNYLYFIDLETGNYRESQAIADEYQGSVSQLAWDPVTGSYMASLFNRSNEYFQYAERAQLVAFDETSISGIELDTSIGSGAEQSLNSAITFDSGSNQIFGFSSDEGSNSLLAYNVETNVLSMIAPGDESFYRVSDVVYHADSHSLYYINFETLSVYRADIETGEINNVTTPTLPDFEVLELQDLAITADATTAYMIMLSFDAGPVLAEVDLVSGKTSIVKTLSSDYNYDMILHDGAIFLGKAAVSTSVQNTQIVRLDLTTDDTTVITDNASIESGDQISSIQHMLVDEAENALYFSDRGEIVNVDLETGSRTFVYSDYDIAERALIMERGDSVFLEDLTLSATPGIAYALDDHVSGIYAVDMTTGARMLIQR